MKLEGEFFMIEADRGYTSYQVMPGGQKGDPSVNYREEAEHTKKVRLLRCQVVEVMEEQA